MYFCYVDSVLSSSLEAPETVFYSLASNNNSWDSG